MYSIDFPSGRIWGSVRSPGLPFNDRFRSPPVGRNPHDVTDELAIYNGVIFIPPRPLNGCAASHKTTGAPPLTAIFFSFPSGENIQSICHRVRRTDSVYSPQFRQ